MTPIERTRLSLDGLSVGDGFGEGYFSNPNMVEELIAQRALPGAPWRWTDDSQMAISIVAVLERYGEINQDVLALQFGERYEPGRGYGPAMHDLMRQYRVGGKWQKLATAMFDGQGSFGNGSGVSCQDTVPFCLWCAGMHLDSYEEALWLTVSGLGDRDTTCAIVGGIISLRAPIPIDWLAAREPLDGKMTDWD